MTREQRQHAREQRALLRLRRAAVRYSFATDAVSLDDLPMAFADLEAACDAYRTVIGVRAANRLEREPRRTGGMKPEAAPRDPHRVEAS